jgi:putative transposase
VRGNELEGYALAAGYQRPTSAETTEATESIDTTLEQLVREGARRMLAAALEEEVTAFLGRGRYERGKPFRGYRNGYLPERELTVGVSAVKVRVPRVADVSAAIAPEGFRSQVVRRYERATPATQALFAQLYLEGLATGDFEPVFRELVGEATALSPSAICRLKEQWADEYASWRKRRLDDHRYAYLWADGVVRHEALCHRAGSMTPRAVCRSRPLKLEAA